MSETTNDRPLTEAEREELERRRREGRPTLDEEITRKYEPSLLKSIVLQGEGRGERLDLATRGEMEGRLPGHDFSDVRVFRGRLAEEVTERHRADAVTIANTGMIMVRESPRSAPGTTSGQALLAHELTHVAQAQRGMLFAREGGGEGEHEQEAEAVEREAAGAGGGKDDPQDPANLGKEMRQMEARRRAIMDRVLEMLQDQTRAGRDRRGDF